MGDYARAAAPDLLMAKEYEKHATEIAELAGRRLAVCSEIPKGKSWAEAKIKEHTGGDMLSGNFMHKDRFEFAPTHKFIVSANTKPRMRGNEEGNWSRIVLVPWPVVIPKVERDRKLAAKLRQELAGILAWAVRGCLDWQKQGLAVPPDAVRATDDYRTAEDKIGLFIEEECELGSQFWQSTAELFLSHQRHCEKVGEYPWTKRAFSDALGERPELKRHEKGKDKTAGYAGIRLKASGQQGIGVRLETIAAGRDGAGTSGSSGGSFHQRPAGES
jgi:P4 family phage/plasmid primase-like protien